MRQHLEPELLSLLEVLPADSELPSEDEGAWAEPASLGSETVTDVRCWSIHHTLCSIA
mgnify:CR=1 FL=1